MACCKALAFIGSPAAQLLLNQVVKVSIQTRRCSSNLCSELDRCQVQIQPGCFGRHVSGEQSDIFERDTSRFERRQPLVAESMRVQLRELERDSQCIDHVIEGASDERATGITRRLRDEHRPTLIEGERVDQSPTLVVQVVVQHALGDR